MVTKAKKDTGIGVEYEPTPNFPDGKIPHETDKGVIEMPTGLVLRIEDPSSGDSGEIVLEGALSKGVTPSGQKKHRTAWYQFKTGRNYVSADWPLFDSKVYVPSDDGYVEVEPHPVHMTEMKKTASGRIVRDGGSPARTWGCVTTINGVNYMFYLLIVHEWRSDDPPLPRQPKVTDDVDPASARYYLKAQMVRSGAAPARKFGEIRGSGLRTG